MRRPAWHREPGGKLDVIEKHRQHGLPRPFAPEEVMAQVVRTLCKDWRPGWWYGLPLGAAAFWRDNDVRVIGGSDRRWPLAKMAARLR